MGSPGREAFLGALILKNIKVLKKHIMLLCIMSAILAMMVDVYSANIVCEAIKQVRRKGKKTTPEIGC